MQRGRRGRDAVPRVSRATSTQGLAARPAWTENEESAVSVAAEPGASTGNRAPRSVCGGRASPPTWAPQSSPGLGKKTVPIFGERKKIRYFLQKYLFFPESMSGALCSTLYYFLPDSCQQKNNTWAVAPAKGCVSCTRFQKVHILGRKKCAVWFHKATAASPSPAS